MGLNTALSSWLRGAQSVATSTLRAAQARAAALQTQTMTAISAAQRAAQPFQAQTRASSQSRNPAPYTARTITPADTLARTVQSGVRGAQEAVQQIARAHAPIVQGVQRDVGRAIQSAPAAVRSAPVAVQAAARQISQAHAPIVQGVQRDVSRAVQAAPGAVRSVPAAAQQAARQISAAHTPIVQGVRRDVGAATRSVGAAGAPQQTARSQAVTSSAAVARHNQEVARYRASPAHAAIPRFQQRYDEAVRRYEHDPQVQTYTQKLAAYNAQLSAHERAVARGQGVPATAERLQNMYGELEGMRSSIDSRKRQELGEIRMLGANLQMMSAPMQAEYTRLQAQERALAASMIRAAASSPASSPTSTPSAVQQFAAAHAPIIEGLQRDAARVWSAVPAPIRDAAAVANLRKREAQAELTRTAGPAASFEQGWTYPVYEAGREANRRYQGFVDQALPLYQRVQPLPNIPEIHSLQRGFARAPGSLLEGLTFLPPAAERGGQLLWKEPHKLPETAARFAGQMYEGMGASYERDPWDFGGEMLGTAVLSYGIGAAARPGAVARGSGAAARPSRVAAGGPGAGAGTPSRAAAGSTQGSGHAGGRFRAMEFGFRTELIRKPVQKQTPFKLSEWQAERQKYARTTPTSVQTTRPAPARQVQIQVEPPGPGTGGGTGGQMAGYGAPYLGYRGPLTAATTTPADQAVEMLTQPQIGPQRGGVQGQRLANPQVSSQDLGVVQEQGSRQDTILALVNAPVSSILNQPVDTILTTRLLNPTDLVTSDPPSRLKHPPVVPLLTTPPRPKAKKEKKKKGNDERRRRRKKGELDHWEIGPAPGLDEMGMLVFGPRPARQRGSYLDFGPPSVGAGGRGVSPKTSPAKKVAHAANTKDTARKQTQTGRRTKNSKR